MSPGFQHQDFEHMTFPNKMYVDYIRVYQRDGVSEGATCNPSKYPTSDYINKCVFFRLTLALSRFVSSLVLMRAQTHQRVHRCELDHLVRGGLHVPEELDLGRMLSAERRVS
jgi:hypothetical protein